MIQGRFLRATSLSQAPFLFLKVTSTQSFKQATHHATRSSSSRSATVAPPRQTSPSSRPGRQLRLIYPEPPSTGHNDLASYDAYATRTGLDPKSTTYAGTHYEYTVAASLRRLGFDLQRVGGRSDGGIDLLGTWAVPSVASSAEDELPLRIILQCKAFGRQSSKVGPQHVRELEGAFVSAPPGWRGNAEDGVVGVLVAQKPATKGVRDSLTRSRWPMVYMLCSKEGRVEQLLWNRRAEEQGLAGMGVAVQHSPNPAGESAEELILTWQGLPYTASIPDAEAPS